MAYSFGFFALLLLSCKDQGAQVRTKDAISSLHQTYTSGVSSTKPGKSCFIVRKHLEKPSYSIFFISRYDLPRDTLVYDSSHYFTGNYITVTRSPGNATDTAKVEDEEDHSGCFTCADIILADLTDSFHIRPVFIQLVTAGEDLTLNSFIGYRRGRLEELFTLGDTEEEGVVLKKTDDSSLSGMTYGIDEVVGLIGHNYPVRVDLRTFTVSHPLPSLQYIGFRTAATEDFKAYRIMNGQAGNMLISVRQGDSLTIDTFYRARQRVGLLVGDSVKVEIKLETARKKLWRPPAAG
ncbi:MAG TPA: hypothetical protein VG052_16615 [Puia sp.]|nr:hypothetical protein [Puia sp.]